MSCVTQARCSSPPPSRSTTASSTSTARDPVRSHLRMCELISDSRYLIPSLSAHGIYVGWHAGPTSHRLPLPIRQRPPAPLKRTESEMAKPDRTHRQAHDPHPEHDVVELIPLQLSEQPQAGRIEDQRVDDRMR